MKHPSLSMPTGCATSCTFGSRSFTGSFNARACDWQGIRKSSACWKQESQEGCFQARFLMSSSSLRIPWVARRRQECCSHHRDTTFPPAASAISRTRSWQVSMPRSSCAPPLPPSASSPRLYAGTSTNTGKRNRRRSENVARSCCLFDNFSFPRLKKAMDQVTCQVKQLLLCFTFFQHECSVAPGSTNVGNGPLTSFTGWFTRRR